MEIALNSLKLPDATTDQYGLSASHFESLWIENLISSIFVSHDKQEKERKIINLGQLDRKTSIIKCKEEYYKLMLNNTKFWMFNKCDFNELSF